MKDANLYRGIEPVKNRLIAGPANPGDAGTNPPVTTPPVATTSATADNANTNAGAANSSSSYNPINNQVWGEGGGGYDAHMEQAEQEAAKRQNDPTYGQAYTNEGMQQAAGNVGISSGSVNTYSQHASPETYTGRTTPEGDSGADEALLSDGEYAYIQYCKQMYDQAQIDGNAEQMAYWHSEAERVRARHNYSGGSDGSMYITNGEMGLANNSGNQGGNGGYYGGSTQPSGSGQGNASGGTTSDLKGLLDSWQQAALAQSNGQIDYAVQQAVMELQRALEDSQSQFKEQAESVAREERQALDNSALYAEMRGDKGGIGQEQYNSIQNTAAQNHLAVQQAQTKLATDTQRQIADLRAQGEFEKANAALQITQQYLQQLVSLEQWAAEYNLSVEQFEASLQQWKAEYDMAMQKLQISQSQWQSEFDAAQKQWQSEFNASQNRWQSEFNASQSQWQQQFDYKKRSDLASLGEALLSAGILLTQEQLTAMGISPEWASMILWQQQLPIAGNWELR